MYYFIVYEWRRWESSSPHWNVGDKLTQKHPLDWLQHMRTKYGEERKGNTIIELSYRLRFWKEVPDHIYNKHRDNIG